MAIHLLPRALLGQQSIVTIHDNLDSDFLYRVLIARGGRFFHPHAIVDEFLGGVPRWEYPSSLKLGSLLFWWLPPFTAYVLLESLVCAAAFGGMWLLLRDVVRPGRWAVFGIAGAFALLPFYTVFDLSVAGQPLVAWALYSLWRRQHMTPAWLVCALFPFASVLATSGVFVLSLAATLLVVAAIATRESPWRPWAGLLVLAAGYLVADAQLLIGLFGSGFVSQRADWLVNGARAIDFGALLRSSAVMFVAGGYHAASLHTPILLSLIVSLPFLARRRSSDVKPLLAVLLVAAALSVTSSVFRWNGVAPLWRELPLLRELNVRFWWSLPTLWFVAFATLVRAWRQCGVRSTAVAGVIALQLLWVFIAPLGAQPELRRNYAALADHVLGRPTRDLSYQEFLSRPVFDAIRERMGEEREARVVSIGLHPAVAALNGFRCADGYLDAYPRDYKYRFLQLIAGELQQDQRQRAYFDEWGSRAYLLLPGVPVGTYDRRPESTQTLDRLDIDEAALRDLGVRWVFSVFAIRDPRALEILRDEGFFADPRAAFPIHLYRVLTVSGDRRGD